MTYTRPEIVSKVTKLDKPFFDNLLDGVDERPTRDEKPHGNVGQRIQGGRMGFFDNSVANTWQVTCEVEAHFDAIQVIFANQKPAYADSAAMIKASVIPSTADLNGSAGTWVPVTKSGLLRMAVPTAPWANRITYGLSDVIPLASIPRTDGGTKPLLVVRALMASSVDLPVLGNGSTDNTVNWASRTDGRLWAVRRMEGDGVNNPALFTSTTNVSQSPIVGVRYWSRGRVVNVMVVGDSISEGRGTYIGEGFGGLVASRLSTPELAVEYSGCGWSGQSTAQYGERAIDILNSEIKPDVLIFPVGSPNNEALYTDAGLAKTDAMYQRVLHACAKNNVTPVLWTILPTAPSVHAWGATDTKRVAANQRALALRSKGVLVADAATPLSGPIVDGQVGLPTTLAPDGIHPGDTGNQLIADELTPLVKRAGGI